MRTVLWDMDGTIADSEQQHFLAWQMTLQQVGVTYVYDHFIADFGRRNGEILSELLQAEPDDDLALEVSRNKEANFRRLIREQGLKPLPGVAAWLERFRARRSPASCRAHPVPWRTSPREADILDVADYFMALMSGATLPKSKPDPAIFLNSAAAMRAQPHECIVVEDSIHGVEGARRAGMGSIAVGNVARSEELQRLLRSEPGPACLAVDTLEAVSWQACEELWGQAGS